MISATYDATRELLAFANAGHWPPLTYIDGAADFVPVSPGFLPLGLDGDTQYEAHDLELPPGSVIVFFSNGMIDATNPDGEFFGEARFQALVRKSLQRSAVEIGDVVTTSVFDFSHGRQKDDQTLMVIKRT